MKKLTFAIAILSIPSLLAGCATATRGSSTMFIIETSPVGARVETNVPIKGTPKLSRSQIKKIKLGKMDEPEFTYRYCEPTPCGIEIPRKLKLDILITKDGYLPQIHTIGIMHRKQIAKETAKNTTIAAGGTAVAGGVIGGSMATMFGGAVTAGPVIAGAAALAAPVVLVGLIAGGVDQSTGANYDYWPNPASVKLIEVPGEEDNNTNQQAIFDEFKARQRLARLAINLSSEERWTKKINEKDKRWKAEKAKRIAAKRAEYQLRKKKRKEERQQEKSSK